MYVPHKTKPQESHHPHFHPNSYLSGVLYISCLPNDYINFSIANLYKPMEFPIKKSTLWNTKIIPIKVIEGDLILFPSSLAHDVALNKTKNKERISLSFNTFPLGEMGEYGKINQLKI